MNDPMIPVAPLAGHFEPQLVLLSVLVASLAGYATLSVAGRADSSRHGLTPALLLSALIMGLGIWAMHFIGMLAYQLPFPVSYAPASVLLSAASSTLGAAVALWLTRRTPTRRWDLPLAGGLLGAGMVGMHYIGMAGMRMDGTLNHQPLAVLLSVVIAVTAATGGLRVARGFGPAEDGHMTWRLLAALVLGRAGWIATTSPGEQI